MRLARPPAAPPPNGAALASPHGMPVPAFKCSPRVGMIGWASLAVTLATMVGSCAEVQEVQEGPVDIPSGIEEKYCVKEVALISQVLAETEALTSCVSESSCDRAIDTEDEGYFETWHLYADEASTVVLEADSEFDNLMQLALITEVTEEAVEAKVIAANDDRSAEDSGARIAATLEAAQDYLLRLSSFGDEETGCYTIRTIRVGPDDPLPEPPDTGSVGVMVSSTGAAPATYTVTLNGAKAKSVAANGTVTYEGIVTGDYAVELSGLGDCIVDGDNPQDATLNANQTTTVSFAVSCDEVVVECDPDNPDACDDENDCTTDGACNSETRECEASDNEPAGTPCDTDDVCDGQGRCVECVGPLQCDDGNECTDPVCDAGSCANDIVAGRACDYMGGSQNGACNAQGQCEEPPDKCPPGHCPDTAEDCTENLCNPSDGSCSTSNLGEGTPCSQPGGRVCDGQGGCVGCNVNADCDDGNMCNGDEVCRLSDHTCHGGSVPFCDDFNECTVNGCDPATGCFYVNEQNGVACSAGTCQGGACVQSAPALSNPNNYYLDINQCAAAPGATTFWYTVNYSDPDGDVVPGGARVFLTSRDDAGGGTSTPAENTNFDVTGDGSGGTIVVEFCLLFRNATWVAVSMVVWDAAENASDPIETVIYKPEGAN